MFQDPVVQIQVSINPEAPDSYLRSLALSSHRRQWGLMTPLNR